MRCPRCQRASPDEAVFCPGCGAPLALPADPAPRALDRSLSLDRRAGRRDPGPAQLDDGPALLDDEPSSSWDLGERVDASVASGPSLRAAAVEDCPDDFEFGPLPELASELEPVPAVAAAAPRLDDEPAQATRTPPPDRPLSRALGLAPDPVCPDDLWLEQDGEADVELPRAARELERELDLGPPAGAPTPPRPFAAAARLLGLDLPDAAPAHGAGALDLALDLGRVPAAPAGELADGGELDLALPASARPDERRLPLPRAGGRPRPAPDARRRAAAWAIDALPFVALGIAAVAAVYGRVPVSPGASAGTVELLLGDGGAIARPLLACVTILALVYQTLAHALAGATLGKWLLGLRLVGPDGARPSFGRSAARAALSAASVLLLGLGFVPALFTRSGRALHDISSGTRVVEAP